MYLKLAQFYKKKFFSKPLNNFSEERKNFETKP